MSSVSFLLPSISFALPCSLEYTLFYLFFLLLPAPTGQIHDFRHPAAAGDDPFHFLVSLVDFLVLGPGGDEGEVAG